MEVIVLFGAEPKVGVTATSQSIAQQLAGSFPDKKILLAPFDGQIGNDYTDIMLPDGMEALRASILSKVVTPEEVVARAVVTGADNLLQLKGICNPKLRGEFHPGDAEYFLRVCSQVFDVTVIDAGYSLNAGLAVGALQSNTAHRMLMTTQQLSAYWNYTIMQELLNKLDIAFEGVLINKVISNMALPTVEVLGQRYQMDTKFFELPFMQYAWQAGEERECLFKYKDRGYNQAITTVVEYLGVLCGFQNEQIGGSKKRRWFRK